MSAPVDTTRVARYAAIQSALCELVSAESSLNMHPDPIEPAIVRTVDEYERVTAEPEPRYTSTTDGNASRAGWRDWQAEDAEHAVEQHVDAFGKDDPMERVLEIRCENTKLPIPAGYAANTTRKP